MIEVVGVIRIDTNLRREELGIERDFLDAAVPFNQVKSAKRKGSGFLLVGLFWLANALSAG